MPGKAPLLLKSLTTTAQESEGLAVCRCCTCCPHTLVPLEPTAGCKGPQTGRTLEIVRHRLWHGWRWDSRGGSTYGQLYHLHSETISHNDHIGWLQVAVQLEAGAQPSTCDASCPIAEQTANDRHHTKQHGPQDVGAHAHGRVHTK